MEIKPQKDYKKPAFAVGLASLTVAAGMTTGCTDNTESEVRTLGEIPVITESKSEPLEYDGGLEVVGEIEFDGEPDVSIPEETETLALDGDVVCPPDDENE